MRNAALQQSPPPSELVPDADEAHERRLPSFDAPIDLAGCGAVRGAEAELNWPGSWPAALYGEAAGGGEFATPCRVRAFSAAAVHLTMKDPPPVGARVSLKFPFTVYLHGRVAWCRGDDLGLAFDPEARRSARFVEDVLFERPAGPWHTGAIVVPLES